MIDQTEPQADNDTAAGREAARSQFDMVMSDIAPGLGGRRLRNLNRNEQRVLAVELGVDRERIRLLSQADTLSRETGLPAAAFYALGQQGMTLDRDLLVAEPASLRQVLETAAAAEIIPSLETGELDRFEQRLVQFRPYYQPLAEFATLAALDLPGEALERLAERGVNTLRDVRDRGGLRSLEGIGDILEESQIAALEARSALSFLPLDPGTTTQLINAGVTSMTGLAHADSVTLAQNLGLGRARIRELQAVAMTHRALMAVPLTDAIIAEVGANQSSLLFRRDGYPVAFRNAAMNAAGDDTCRNCDPCRSALSPAAYLVDLIDLILDSFRSPHSQSPEIQPLSFPDLASLETRFRRPFGSLTVGCSSVQQPVRQIELAIEVLERFLTTPPVSGYTREFTYGRFGDLNPFRNTPLYPKPNVLAQMADAYLTELGIQPADFRAALQAAYPAGGAADPAPLDDIASDLGLTTVELTTLLSINNANWQPTIAVIDQLPDLVRRMFTDGLAANDPAEFAAYQDAISRAEAAIGRVRQRYLPDIRANLIAIALRDVQRANIPPELAALTTERQLGDYLHVDLAADVCQMTTRVAEAIEALQSFVYAFLSGREQPGYWLSFADTSSGAFESRWAWVERYGIWQAAQMVFLYPENFLMARARVNSTGEFIELLDALDEAAGNYEDVLTAVRLFREAIPGRLPAISFTLANHPLSLNGLGTRVLHNIQQGDYSRLQPGDPRRRYLDEWYLYLPLAVASALNAARDYERAAMWLCCVLFPIGPGAPENWSLAPIRHVWWGFEENLSEGYDYREDPAWLQDPFTPFAIARLRKGAMERHLIIQHVENLLDWADAEFTRDDTLSIARARELYERALEMLEVEAVSAEDVCQIAWRRLQAELSVLLTGEELRLVQQLLDPLAADPRLTLADIEAFGNALHANDPLADRLDGVMQRVTQIKGRPLNERTIGEIVADRQGTAAFGSLEGIFDRYYASEGDAVDMAEILSPSMWLVGALAERLVGEFCAPANSIFTLLRFRAQSNLEKIATCRNIAGMRRTVRTYAAAADPARVIQARVDGAEPADAVPDAPPPIYRFSYLIERARYSVNVAQQLENLLLNAFQQEDQAQFSQMQARQGLQVAQGQVQLQVLRQQEAEHHVTLAILQRERSRFQTDYFAGLIRAGLSGYETQALGAIWAAHDWAIAGTTMGSVGAIAGGIIGAIFGPPGSAAGAIAGAVAGGGQLFMGISQVNSLYSQARSMQATFERREQEWTFQRNLSDRDFAIGEQGVTLANDQVNIREQESSIATLQVGHAAEVVTFLGTKFLNVALWQWMGRTLRGYYREHLNIATVVARMAQTALEFERQESIPIIAAYYREQERRDLLAAEQLLTDISRLDQHRLLTEQRKKEITKIYSLASADPVEMQRLRQEGSMTFTTRLTDFDRDFPGHYMRLIKSITISVIALIPPVEGIHAVLSNAGVSRVMVGPPYDEPRVIQRLPETIALSIPHQATGLFEMRLDDPILLPFEASGVETIWTLEMPKGANRFDYGAIADVLFTIRYTALEDVTYRTKVLQQMGVDANGILRQASTISFNITQAFPDEWYDLHNPEFVPDVGDYGFGPGKVKPPYQLQIKLRAIDFAPNEDRQRLTRVSLALRQESFARLPLEIEFQPEDSVTRYAYDSDYTWDPQDQTTAPWSFVAFTHQRNAEDAPWQAAVTPLNGLAPFGTWWIKIKNGGKRLDGQAIASATYPEVFGQLPSRYNQEVLDLTGLQDILLALAYEADTTYRYSS